jgi:tRNA A22 N-methylase
MNKRQKRKQEKNKLAQGKVILTHGDKSLKMKWNRTDEQHQKFLADGVKKKEKLHLDLKNEIEEIIELVNLFDKKLLSNGRNLLENLIS